MVLRTSKTVCTNMALKRLFDVCSKLQRPKAARKSKKKCQAFLARALIVKPQSITYKVAVIEGDITK